MDAMSAPCSDCGGIGRKHNRAWEGACPTCKGTGFYGREDTRQGDLCAECGGSGVWRSTEDDWPDRDCPRCLGSGKAGE